MKKLAIAMLAIFCVAVFASGCATKTCNTIMDECNLNEAWKINCKDDYMSGDSDCKKAMRDWADCIEDKGCDSAGCSDESVKVANKCN